jgi:cell division protein FtsW
MTALTTRHPDTVLLTVATAMAIAGVALSGSARVYQDAAGGAPNGLISSLAHLTLGLLALTITMLPDYRALARPAVVWSFLAGVSVLLVVVLFTPEVNHTHRWMRIAGFSLQPSELAKPVLVIAVAAALVRGAESLRSWSGLMRPLIVAGWLCGLVVLGKDLGTPTVMFGTTLAMTLVAGARWKHLAMLATGAASAFLALAWLEPYRWKRLSDFTAALDLSTGSFNKVQYQLQQSILAVGAGGVTGKGFGMSTQKALFLPEAEDDFIFAVIAEELGLVGGCAVLTLFIVIAWRGVRVAERAGDDFGKLIALGASWLLAGQAIVHAAVVTGLLPTKGLPLPFLSAGGSSLLASCLLTGLILNVSLRGRRDV